MNRKKNQKQTTSQNKVQSKPAKEIPFSFNNKDYRAQINRQGQISFFQDDKQIENPEEQNQLMKQLLILNALPSGRQRLYKDQKIQKSDASPGIAFSMNTEDLVIFF